MHRILASTIIQAHIGGSVCGKRRRTSRVFAILPAAANGPYLRLVQLPLPVTPFHLGPGALLKAVAPRHVSWTTFALANGLIDVEPIFYFLFNYALRHQPSLTLAADHGSFGSFTPTRRRS
jgi:hypothetical protein